MTKRLTIALLALAVLFVIAIQPATASLTGANTNGTLIAPRAAVFIGEQGLNISATMPGSTIIAWFPSTAQLDSTTPEKTIDVTATRLSFFVNPADFSSRTGNWYCWTAGQFLGNSAVAFYVYDPSMDIAVWDIDQNGPTGKDVTGKNIVQGTRLVFRLTTNGYPVVNPAMRPRILQPVWETALDATNAGAAYGFMPSANKTMYGLDPFLGTGTAGAYGFTGNKTADGWVDIKVKTAEGNTLTALYNGSAATATTQAIPLTGMFVNSQPWFWGNATIVTAAGGAGTPVGNNSNWMWQTAARLTTGMDAYPPGTYTVTAEWVLNSMKDNYKNAGADYAGKTISESRSLTLVSDTVKIEVNKDSVVRTNAFSTTITGRPNQQYFLWVKGTSTLAGANATTIAAGATPFDQLAPQLAPNQAGLFQDTGVLGPGLGIGSYIPQNLPRTMGADVPAAEYWMYYGRVLTADTGVRIIEWTTSNWTKAQTFNIRVENATVLTAATRDFKTDEVSIKVEKGAVTITASGDGSYYLGEEVKFSGTNTESRNTYLFIVGPNLQVNGSNIASTDPRLAANAAATGNAATFASATVASDNTWSYKWGTATVAIDAGTYTVYAVSAPNNRGDLTNVAYGTVSIIIKKPFVSATASASTVAQGDKVYVRGTAEGKPSPGVAMWVLGKNYAQRWTTAVNTDASFQFDNLDTAATTNLAPGQYFIVVQHPMQNDQFDIVMNTAAGLSWIRNLQLNPGAGGTNVFQLLGASSLQGSDAAEALVQAINDPNVDDTYTKLQILVEVPVIRIDSIGDRHVGDKFTITAQTNLAVDDEVLFEVYSSSFKPTQKSQSGEFSGATGTVKVAKGDTGMNKLSFDVDASTFKPDEYLVQANAVLQTATGTTLFNVLEGAAPTAAPTAVVTTAPPATAAPTTAAPTTAAPTKAPTQPGFGALVALIGLGAVAFLVVRRH